LGTDIRPVELIGAAIGEGAPDARTRGGPGSLRRWGLGGRLSARGREVRWGPVVGSDRTLVDQGPLAVVAEFAGRLASQVARSLAQGHLPVVVGGDHSCAVGTWSAAAAALRLGGASRRLGLVWIDAHLDAHTPETSASQMPHGMPLAVLLGHGPASLTGLAGPEPALDPAHVVLIGPRSWEAGEAALLARLGVRVMAADEVSRRGFADCMAEAVRRVGGPTAGWGVSFDLDALDPTEAPGTGSRVARGLRVADVTAALRGLACDPRLIACELVEYTPELDRDRITATAAEAVLGALVERRCGPGPAGAPAGPERRVKAQPATGRP
jgi:arginase